MIAWSFPPASESGTARQFHFAKHLREFGWFPTVLAPPVGQRAVQDDAPLAELAGRCDIVRVRPLSDTPGLKPLAALAALVLSNSLDDRKQRMMAWLLGGTARGLRELTAGGCQVIWASGPPWHALCLGYILSRATGKPLVADIRDPWTYGVLWRLRARRSAARDAAWERRVLARAARIVYTSPLTGEIMKRRMGPSAARHMVTITNGFGDGHLEPQRQTPDDLCLFRYVGRLLHAHKHPDILLRALAEVCRTPEIRRSLRFQFVGQMDGIEEDLNQYGLGDVVQCIGHVPQQESLRIMRGADVLTLLVTTVGEGNDVISGKAYEYLAAGKPILAVVADGGGDAWLVNRTRCGLVTGITDVGRVADGIRRLWRLWREGRLDAVGSGGDISMFNRRALTGQLARLLDDVAQEGRPAGAPA